MLWGQGIQASAWEGCRGNVKEPEVPSWVSSNMGKLVKSSCLEVVMGVAFNAFNSLLSVP
jgi:hypothetical protein